MGKTKIILLFVGGTLLSAGLFAFFTIRYYQKKSQINNTEQKQISQKQTTQKSVFESAKLPINKTPVEVCTSDECFNEMYTKCKAATVETSSILGKAKYEILGYEARGCSVKIKLLESTNPRWLQEEMTCTLDQNSQFSVAVTQAFIDISNGKLKCNGNLDWQIRKSGSLSN